MSEWVPQSVWETIVRHVPIPSVDLIVRCPQGLILGKRTNEPAKGEWFVPGGRIHKGEELEEAVQRTAETELGTKVTIEESLGAYTHLYGTSEIGENVPKHYVAHGYVVWIDQTPDLPTVKDNQHEAFRVFKNELPQLHPHVRQYLNDARLLNEDGTLVSTSE